MACICGGMPELAESDSSDESTMLEEKDLVLVAAACAGTLQPANGGAPGEAEPARLKALESGEELTERSHRLVIGPDMEDLWQLDSVRSWCTSAPAYMASPTEMWQHTTVRAWCSAHGPAETQLFSSHLRLKESPRDAAMPGLDDFCRAAAMPCGLPTRSSDAGAGFQGRQSVQATLASKDHLITPHKTIGISSDTPSIQTSVRADLVYFSLDEEANISSPAHVGDVEMALHRSSSLGAARTASGRKRMLDLSRKRRAEGGHGSGGRVGTIWGGDGAMQTNGRGQGSRKGGQGGGEASSGIEVSNSREDAERQGNGERNPRRCDSGGRNEARDDGEVLPSPVRAFTLESKISSGTALPGASGDAVEADGGGDQTGSQADREDKLLPSQVTKGHS